MYLIIALTAHEISHLLLAILLKIEFSKIRISIFGFSFNAKLNEIRHLNKIVLYLAGPLCNLFLYISFKNTQYLEFANINLFLAYMNLIPIVPLDGGNICKTILEIFVDMNTVSRYITMTNSFFILCFITIIHTYKNYLYFLLILMGLKGVVEENSQLLEQSILVIYNKYKR